MRRDGQSNPGNFVGHRQALVRLAYGEPSYLELWKTLPADSEVDEVVRYFFIRQPVLWVP